MTPRWDHAHVATAIGAAMVAAGFAAIVLSWRGVAALLSVPLQVPFLLSGAGAGLALVGGGAAVLTVQARRVDAARERLLLHDLLDAAGRMLAAVGAPARALEPKVVPGRTTYHLAACPVAGRLRERAAVALDAAERAGLRPCRRCLRPGVTPPAATRAGPPPSHA